MPITRTCGPRICHVSDVRADDIPLIEHPGFAEHHYSSLVRREGMFPAHCQLFWSPEAMKRYSIWSVDFAKEDCLKGLKNCGLLWVHDKSDRFVPLFTPKPMAQGSSSPGNVVWTHGNSYASNDNFRRLLQFMDEAGLAYDPPLPKPLNSAQLPDLSGLYEVIGVATPRPGRITGLPNNDLAKARAANAVSNNKPLTFSGEKPTLSHDQFSPDIVNQRSADFYSLYGDNPFRGTLSHVDARKWYLGQEANIPGMLDTTQPLSSQARQAFDLRNQFRSEARELMQDRISADRLFREETNLSWERLVNKTEGKLINRGVSNPTSDQIYQEIIDSSQRSRQSVNKALGL